MPFKCLLRGLIKITTHQGIYLMLYLYVRSYTLDSSLKYVVMDYVVEGQLIPLLFLSKDMLD